MLIALEGIDGSGKATQRKMLCRWLEERGFRVFSTAEPTEGEIGRLIREFLRGKEYDSKAIARAMALLFAADRALHVDEIEQKLNQGYIVVTERYFYSSIAYQGSLGVSPEWIKCINRFAPPADVVFCLDISPEEAIERIKKSKKTRENYERVEFLRKVREAYRRMAEEYESFYIIQADKPREEVHLAIIKKLEGLL